MSSTTTAQIQARFRGSATDAHGNKWVLQPNGALVRQVEPTASEAGRRLQKERKKCAPPKKKRASPKKK